MIRKQYRPLTRPERWMQDAREVARRVDWDAVSNTAGWVAIAVITGVFGFMGLVELLGL